MTMLELVFRAPHGLSLPFYPGSAIRGVLGRSLRSLTCTTQASRCDGCPVHNACPYGLIWEPQPSDALPKRHRTPPPPYIVEAPFAARPTHLRPGARVGVRVRLFGHARNHQTAVVQAAAGMDGWPLGQSNQHLVLERAERVEPPSGARTVVLDQDGLHPLPAGAPWRITPQLEPAADAVRLTMLTPLNLTGPTRPFTPELLTARLSERLDVMALAWEHDSGRTDFQTLRSLSRRIPILEDRLHPVRFERRSHRTQPEGTWIPMAGHVGHVLMGPVPPPVLALWRCAEHLHVGGDTIFGFGAVRVEALRGSVW